MKTVSALFGFILVVTFSACGDVVASEGGADSAGATSVDLTAAPSGTYRTDPHHAYIVFSYNHMGYSRPQIRWRNWTGALNWNAEDPSASTLNVEIDANSIDTAVEELDKNLKSGNYFDVAHYPKITFTSTSVERTGESTGKLTGDLTIKGVTKPVTFNVVINRAADDDFAKAYKLGFSGTAMVSRSDFGMNAFVPLVSDAVQIDVEAEFIMPHREK